MNRAQHAQKGIIVHRLSLAAPAALLSILLVACGGATATAPASAGPTDTPTAEPTPTATAAGTPNPLASFDFNQDKALEGLLPDAVGNLKLTKFSLKGAEFFTSADPEFKGFLDRVHAQPDDVSVASATDTNTSLQLLALRVAGANTDDLKAEFRRAIEQSSTSTIKLSEATVGGKSVLTGFDPDQQANVYFYVVGDVLIFVTASDKALAEAALAKLP
ncbi:MAG: hypothetical protein M3R49_09280 [Chloroflexota bacterium]|nr:hypothetical protein [Chloroflexota bacterium]MDQ2940895.1 hypothetical protein [Chloroflexota bacterium]